MAVAEHDLVVDERTIRVRTAGDPDGFAVIYFHGTPGSRLDLAFGDDLAGTAGVRLISFDRPGYGGSTAAPFGLLSVAADALNIADELGVAQFAPLGLSGGGPFALATGLVAGPRVVRIGVASGAGPFQEIPDALDGLSEIDAKGVALLPGNPTEAAVIFASYFEPIMEALRQGDEAVRAVFQPVLSAHDKELFADPLLGGSVIASMREGLRHGAEGAGWDNVAWLGEWEIDPAAISTPVSLWYGDEDLMAPQPHARWLDAHLPAARLVMRPGEGHLGIFEHLPAMLSELIAG
jgi:pimeloyl-ACP methyl ester carboxylesterase